MEDWKDISTAPKDGIVVDLLTVGGTRWTDMRRAKIASEGWVQVDYPIFRYAESQFTHWMPIPSPPSDKGE